ncbi:hypothetical protein ACOSP7_009288 [Xanthoceras sorbifolium]
MSLSVSSSLSCPFSVNNIHFLTTATTTWKKLHTRNLYPYPFHRKLTTRKRHRFSPQASSLVLPLLPFNVNEVLVPSESKTLHLYEARYLALLDEAEPYLKGEVIPMQDAVPDSSTDVISFKVSAVKDAVYSLNSLEIKLKAPKQALLQTQIVNSLLWADKELSLDCDGAFIPSLPERISFAAFQPVTGSTKSEVLKLQQKKLSVMDLRDTEQRLNDSLEFLKENISMVVAKLAIQSIEMQ